MWNYRAVFALVISVLFFPAIAWANPKPSFDCAKASSFAEIAICSNDELAQLDVRMSKAYKAQLAATSNITSAKAAQRAWVKKREACGSVACIRTLYAARIPELGGGIVAAAANNADEPAGTFVVANTLPPDDYLSLRTEPSTKIGSRITKMANGTELKVLDRRSDGWWRVEIVATGQSGWASSGSSKKYIVWKPSTKTASATSTTNAKSAADAKAAGDIATKATVNSQQTAQKKYENIKASKGFGDYLEQINFPSKTVKDLYVSADREYAIENYAGSFEKLKELETSNFAPALYAISIFYEKGQQVGQDYQKAFEYIERSASMGYDRAQFRLGQLFDPQANALNDQNQAELYYRLSASQGFPDAAFNLATWYDDRSSSLVRLSNPAEAIRLYEIAADAGFALAQTNLGIIYLNGFGVPKDHQLAFKWLKKAADQGEHAAEFNLALMYEKGDYTTTDTKLAKEYMKKAAYGGYPMAIEHYHNSLLQPLYTDFNSKFYYPTSPK